MPTVIHADKLVFADLNPAEQFMVRGKEALERLRPELDALTERDLSPMNADISVAVSRALGVAPGLTALRSRIENECPGIDLRLIDDLEDRAYAASLANNRYESAIAPPPGFQAVVDEAFEARTVLVAAARLLVAVNLLKSDDLVKLNNGHGYHDVADDLQKLVNLYESHWPRIEGRLPFKHDQIDRVQALSEKLLHMLGLREQAPQLAAADADLRARTFTLLDCAYDEVRRAVSFVRWRDGDADDIAPALRNRGGGRRVPEKPADKATDKTAERSAESPAPQRPAAPASVAAVVTNAAPPRLPSGDAATSPYANE